MIYECFREKFFYHMPFYRVIQKYKELGVKISDSTMNDWYAATCEDAPSSATPEPLCE